jgi:hypothetical protein
MGYGIGAVGKDIGIAGKKNQFYLYIFFQFKKTHLSNYTVENEPCILCIYCCTEFNLLLCFCTCLSGIFHYKIGC